MSDPKRPDEPDEIRGWAESLAGRGGNDRASMEGATLRKVILATNEEGAPVDELSLARLRRRLTDEGLLDSRPTWRSLPLLAAVAAGVVVVWVVVLFRP